MNGLDISNGIVDFLKTKISNINIKATPEATYAPKSYEMIDASKIILVWFDSVPSYIGLYKTSESGNVFGPAPYLKNNRIVVSIGLRCLKNSPELDLIVDDVETSLINFQLTGLNPLKPVTISKMTDNGDSVYWRQIWFDAQERKEIKIHDN